MGMIAVEYRPFVIYSYCNLKLTDDNDSWGPGFVK